MLPWQKLTSCPVLPIPDNQLLAPQFSPTQLLTHIPCLSKGDAVRGTFQKYVLAKGIPQTTTEGSSLAVNVPLRVRRNIFYWIEEIMLLRRFWAPCLWQGMKAELHCITSSTLQWTGGKQWICHPRPVEACLTIETLPPAPWDCFDFPPCFEGLHSYFSGAKKLVRDW